MVNKQLVFVYGTLRRNERNHRLLKGARCMAEQAWTTGTLFNTNSGYPILQEQDSDFVYGSCMDDRRFKKVNVNHYFSKVIGRGVLEGYTLRFTRRSFDGGRADIVEEGGVVEGKVYEIPSEAISYLYKREGVNAGCYRPAIVDVEMDGRMVREVLTFVVVDKEEEVAPPGHYMEEILRGGSVLSASYLKGIEERCSILKGKGEKGG